MTKYARCKCGQYLIFFTGNEKTYIETLINAIQKNPEAFSTNKQKSGELYPIITCQKCGKVYDDYSLEKETVGYEDWDNRSVSFAEAVAQGYTHFSGR